MEIITLKQWTERFNPPDFGYFAIREGRFSDIVWHPGIIELQDGIRDSAGELVGDQWYAYTSWQHLRDDRVFNTAYLTWELWQRIKPITEKEYKWLMILKQV